MVIETRLTRDQFIRLSVMRHFQRPMFYLNALACAAFTAYALFQGPWYIFILGWAPFMLYIIYGFFSAFQQANRHNHPYSMPTRYEFSNQGVHVSTSAGDNLLPWDQFVSWSTMADCYVLGLSAGSILAFPIDSVPQSKQPRLEDILKQNIGRYGQFVSRQRPQ